MPQCGKHKKIRPELTLLSNPYSVKQLLAVKYPENEDYILQRNFLRLIKLFDKKKMTALCPECSRQAKVLAFFQGTAFYKLWCGRCSPFWLRQFRYRMVFFSRYMLAVNYVEQYLADDKQFLRWIIRDIAQFKGLPEKMDTAKAVEFFRLAEEEIKNSEPPLKPDSQKDSHGTGSHSTAYTDPVNKYARRFALKDEPEINLNINRRPVAGLNYPYNKGALDSKSKNPPGKNPGTSPDKVNY